jgi:hypothetical protein
MMAVPQGRPLPERTSDPPEWHSTDGGELLLSTSLPPSMVNLVAG